MGKFTEYPQAQSVDKTSNIFLMDNRATPKTESIIAGTLANSLLVMIDSDHLYSYFDDNLSPEMHRMIFRGKNLGTTFTDEQKRAVKNGTFKDIYLGDYWKNGDYTYRIVDIDYWYRAIDGIDYKSHHLVIMPDEVMGKHDMHSEYMGYNGYLNSDLYNYLESDEETAPYHIIRQTFKRTELFPINQYFVNNIDRNTGDTIGYEKAAPVLQIPSERMIYGSEINGKPCPTTSKSQLALFALAPQYILGNGKSMWGTDPYWLRDACGGEECAFIDEHGLAHESPAWQNTIGIRPVFAIYAVYYEG